MSKASIEKLKKLQQEYSNAELLVEKIRLEQEAKALLDEAYSRIKFRYDLYIVLGGLVLGVFTTIVAVNVGPTIISFYASTIVPVVSQWWINIIGVIGIVVAGFLLFQLKRKALYIYGGLEFLVGFVAGWFGISKLQDIGLVEVIAVMSAIYLIVRAFDNIHSQLEANQKKAIIAEVKKETGSDSVFAN